MKETPISKWSMLADALLEGFSPKYALITAVAALLAMTIRKPKLNLASRILVALLCGGLSGFTTSEIAFVLGVRKEAENTIAALMGILLYEFVKTYMDVIARRVMDARLGKTEQEDAVEKKKE